MLLSEGFVTHIAAWAFSTVYTKTHIQIALMSKVPKKSKQKQVM
jgi:hypothetical protein